MARLQHEVSIGHPNDVEAVARILSRKAAQVPGWAAFG
jgi:hypothetical protein